MKVKSVKNMRVRTKLTLLGAISIAGLIILGLESIVTTKQINQASTDISQSWLPSIILAEELNAATSDYRIKECYHVLAKEPEMMNLLEEELDGLRRKIEADFSAYEPYITSEQDREMMDKAKSLWQRYLAYSDRLLKISRENAETPERELIIGDSQILFSEARSLFLDVVNFNKEGAEAASIHGDHLYAKLTRVKLLTIIVVSLMIIMIIIYIIRSIERPVVAILDGARRVSNGDLDVILNYESEDEIGLLTDSVNSLIQRLKSIIDDEKYLFQEIGNGNLDAESGCETAYRGDFAPILYALTGLKCRLGEMAEKEKDSQTDDECGMDVTDKKSRLQSDCKKVRDQSGDGSDSQK